MSLAEARTYRWTLDRYLESKYAPATSRKRGEHVDVLAAPGKTIEVSRLLP